MDEVNSIILYQRREGKREIQSNIDGTRNYDVFLGKQALGFWGRTVGVS